MKEAVAVVPAYNEAGNIGKVLDKLSHMKDFDVMVVDDGSDDRTAKVAEKLGSRTINHPFNLGGNFAVYTGLIYAHRRGYKYAVRLDGDGQHDPRDVATLLSPLKLRKADFVTGSRWLEPSSYRSSLIRRLGQVASSRIASAIVKTKITDITSGFRAYNSKALKYLVDLYEKGKFNEESIFLIEETVALIRDQMRFVEVPVSMKRRRYGSSKSYSFRRMLVFPFRLTHLLIKIILGR